MTIKTYIVVRTQLEGFHCYPGASDINPQIAFLEQMHRHMFKIELKIEVFHNDRELEFFLVKWDLEDFLRDGNFNSMSCETIASHILYHVIGKYGTNRQITVIVSEDGESDGVIEYCPE